MQRYIVKFAKYLEVEKNASAHTRAAYERDLREFARFLSPVGEASPPEPSGVRGGDVTSFVASLHGRRKNSTVARKLSSIKSFFAFLVKKGIVKSNPASFVPSPKVASHLPIVLTVEEAKELVETPKPATTIKDRRKAGVALRDLAILELLYSAGIRVSELVGLSCGSVDIKNNSLRVLGKGGKERVAFLGGYAVAALSAYDLWLRKEGAARVLESPFFPRGWRYAIWLSWSCSILRE